MEQKEIKITVPEGYEIDKENSTFERIKFKKKALTYDDVAKALFDGNGVNYITKFGDIEFAAECESNHLSDPNNATTPEQLGRLLALNKLMNVATYLNTEVLDWNDENNLKVAIGYSHINKQLCTYATSSMQCSHVYFNSKELALQAIDILGERVFKTALGVFE